MIAAAGLLLTGRATPQSSGSAGQGLPDSTFQELSSQALAARDRGDATKAAELYKRILAANPAWADGWWYLGQIRYSASNYALATDAFTHYLRLTPTAAPALALRGLCEFELGEYQPSLDDIDRALALGAADSPRNAQILRYHQGMLLTRLGRFEEALAAYAYFAQQNISSPEMFAAIGLAALRQAVLPGQPTPAPQELLLAAGRAVWLLQSGDRDAAADALQHLFQQFPATPNLHYTWGYLLYSTDQDAAIAQFQQEIAVNPASGIAQTMLAWALLMDGEAGQALPHAQKAAADLPALPLARLSLGRAQLETGDVKTATATLESALRLDPQNLEVHIALARAYSESGREEEARRERLACLQMTAHPDAAAPAGPPHPTGNPMGQEAPPGN